MSEEQQNVPPQGNNPQETPWQEIGRQFQTLGESLAKAVRTTWEDEETQRTVQEMRSGLESMAQEVGQAIEDTAHSQQGEHFRQEAERTAESLRVATEETFQEVRPQLITALEDLNTGLRKLIERMDSRYNNTANNPPAASGSENTAQTPPQDNENLF